MPNRVESLIAEIQGNMTRTYGHFVSMVLMECRSDMSAAVVEPVGLKANWSENDKFGVLHHTAFYSIRPCARACL